MKKSYVNAKGEVVSIGLMNDQYLLNAYNYYRKHPANFVEFKTILEKSILPVEVTELQDIYVAARGIMIDYIQMEVKELVAALYAEIKKRKLDTKGGENTMRRIKKTVKQTVAVDESMDTLKRFTPRSIESFENMTRMVGSYVDYLDRHDLYEVYSDKFGYELVRPAIRKMLMKAWEKAELTGNLTVKDPVIEKWAKDNGYKMVN